MTQTNAGRDWQARVMGDTSSNGSGSYAPANYIGLTANADAPDAAHTTLTGELGGSLARAQGVYAHTNGAATYTISKSFVSDASVTVAKMGLFNAPSGGTLAFETLLDSSAQLKSGDTLQVIWTGTI